MTLILHIGAGKCGSSAIQAALTQRPRFQRRDGSTVEYIAIDRQGQLVRGERLRESAGIAGYRTSPPARPMRDMDLAALAGALQDVGHDVVLSEEAWIYQAEHWADILQRTGMDAEVFAYVRPQVPLLNSAWWQWGAWKDKPFDEWMATRLRRSLWGARMQEWRSVPGVWSVNVRLLPDDVVADMYSHVLDVEPPEETAFVNASLPGDVLRLFQRNRELRPHAHAGRIDFVLSKLKLAGTTPWVLSPEWIARILSETQLDNEVLLSMLDEASAARMRADPRWWDAAAFQDKVAEPPTPVPLDPEALEKLCVELVKALGAPPAT
ncbi:hypothetical protein [Agrilutibacter solisilvae]|uniref:Sulfotransferase family protein n=1 Tax=Agrilutibacter solisilvae TaxID=2763317 RepID=A0A974Y0B2_9GAMM|nr:hypothetical protein [Lysobacter solisilvae]QSX78913.1 hypothetical protein I8J32_003020 [Lysobacter solisilvae]